MIFVITQCRLTETIYYLLRCTPSPVLAKEKGLITCGNFCNSFVWFFKGGTCNSQTLTCIHTGSRVHAIKNYIHLQGTYKNC